MNWKTYQNWAIRSIGGEPSKVKNKGYDGIMPEGDWIEVKKWKNPAGISSYRQVLEGLEKTSRAYIIADKFSSDLKEKKAEVLRTKGWELFLIPQEDLLGDLVS